MKVCFNVIVIVGQLPISVSADNSNLVCSSDESIILSTSLRSRAIVLIGVVCLIGVVGW